MKHYLLVDLGTGNSRVALVDANGAILGLRTYTNVYHRDSAYEDAQYFLPEEWAPLLLQGCRELCGEHPARMSGLTQSPQPAPVRALYC